MGVRLGVEGVVLPVLREPGVQNYRSQRAGEKDGTSLLSFYYAPEIFYTLPFNPLHNLLISHYPQSKDDKTESQIC